MAVRAVGEEPAAGAWPKGRRLTGRGGMPHRRVPHGSDDGLGRWPVESVRVEALGEEEEARRDAPEKAPRLGDWARGRVEEEDGREAADHLAGGTVARLVGGR
jgi:hypothetical protein